VARHWKRFKRFAVTAWCVWGTLEIVTWYYRRWPVPIICVISYTVVMLPVSIVAGKIIETEDEFD
jgi:hypothetical protein